MKKLEPTYGNFRVRGIVRQLSLPYAYQEGETRGGIPYRRLQFLVQTNEKSYIPVELFGMKFDEVTIASKDRNNKSRKKITYSENLYNEIPEDWEVFMGINVGLTQDEDGKNITKTLVPYDAVKEIKDNLEDGDSVFVNGGLRFNEYNSNTQQSFEIRSIYHTSTPIDFSDEDFVETATFDQVIILTGGEFDKKTKRLNLNANIVYNKDGNFVPFSFFIDANKYQKFALKMFKFKFGTEIRVSGLIRSTVDVDISNNSTVESDEWGEDVHNTSSGVIRDIIKEFEITKGYPDTLVEQKYSEDDFVVQVDEVFTDDNDGWGNDDSFNPFEGDEFGDLDENDPFA